MRPLEERLAHDGGRAAGRRVRGQRVEVHRHVGPPEHVRLGERRQLLDPLHAAPPRHGLERQEEHPERHVVLRDQARVVREAVEQERPRDVEQQPRAVAGRAAVVELPAQVERDVDDAALGHPLARGQEAHAARVPRIGRGARDAFSGAHRLSEICRIGTTRRAVNVNRQDMSSCERFTRSMTLRNAR